MKPILVNVSDMAKHLGVSRARVKKLLAQDRMRGFKHPTTGRWMVCFPPTITHGTRGPQLGQNKSSLPAARNRATCDRLNVQIPDAATGNNFVTTPSEERK